MKIYSVCHHLLVVDHIQHLSECDNTPKPKPRPKKRPLLLPIDNNNSNNSSSSGVNNKNIDEMGDIFEDVNGKSNTIAVAY